MSSSEEQDSDLEALQNQQRSQDPKKQIYKENQMLQKVLQIQKQNDKTLFETKNRKIFQFQDQMSITSDKKIQFTTADLTDDIQKEVQFYNIALENSQVALSQLEKEGVKIWRPDDFMAEMLKKDKIMQKIKSKLVKSQIQIQNYEEKKTRMQDKKFSKLLRDKQNKAKSFTKRQNLGAIEDWKQDIKKSGDKAKDLSEYILNNRKIQNKDKQGRRGQKFQGRDQNQVQGQKAKFDKKTGKKFAERKQRGPMNKKIQKRPGKVTRMQNRNKKNSKK